MAKPWDITGDDIDRWSHRVEAAGVLPDLVRRLLLATSPLSSISMPSHAGTRLGGVDGVVRASMGSAFCPAGSSVWELSVENTKQKFDDDYRKRTDEPAPFDRGRATYVAASARRIAVATRQRWESAWRADRIWGDIRLLDADDLATWLSTAPAVARWFAGKLKHPAAGAEDLDGFLEAWSRRTRVRLPVEIALAGEERQRLAEGVRGWARSARRDGPPLRVFGDTWEEAAVFVSAAIATDPSPDGEQVRARTIVVRSEEGLRAALVDVQAQPLLVVTAFAGASTDVGQVALALEGPIPANALGVVRLAPVPYLRFAEILAANGMPPDEAGHVARDSGGKLIDLQRQLGYVALPRWAEGMPSIPLAAMLLAGAFEPASEGDREALSLLGADPREVELLCERLRLGPDAPTHKEEGRAYRAVWTWRSPQGAWDALVGQIPADTLRRFGDVVRRVLGERDPSLDMKPEERFAAAVQGKVLTVSGSLREGLTRSLVRLALSDDALAPLHGPKRGSTLASIAVRDLLPQPWEAWASLSGLLPLLAEAAPDRFLDCVDASLRVGEAGVARLLAEEAHTGVLWALETLGWDERLMPRVASALAKLAEYDEKWERPGRLANRPKSSLEGLFRIGMPQTNASDDVLIREMQRGLQETREVTFYLLVRLVVTISLGTMFVEAHKPWSKRIAVPGQEEQASRRQGASRRAKAYLDLALEHVGNDARRWAYLLRHGRVNARYGERILERFESVHAEIVDEHAEVWGAIRHVLHWMSEGERWQNWKRLYDEIEPPDLVLRYAWLFVGGIELPKPFAPAMNLKTDGEDLGRLCSEAVEHIGRQPDRVAILTLLVERVNATSSLGYTLGNATFAKDLDSFLLDSSPPACFVRHIPGFLAARWNEPGWVESKLRSMLAQGRKAEVETALVSFGANTAVWDMAKSLGEDTHVSYWRALEYVFGEHSPEEWERAIHSFMEVGNFAGAVRNVDRAKDKVQIDTVAQALSVFVATPTEVIRLKRDPAFSYILEQLMDHLEAAPDADSKYGNLLANVELIYALSTFEPERPMRRLSVLFAADYRQFVDLHKRVYRRNGEPLPDRTAEKQGDVSQAAESAYRVLEAWTGYPGEGYPTEVRESVLHDWSLAALRELVAEGRPDTGAYEVARVLARAPDGEDGSWPCVAARRLLELDEFPALAYGLQVAKGNLRGMTERSLGEGGKQERVLAAEYRDAAKKLRAEWPRTADMLDRLAETYEHDAAREDAEAEATMRQHGAEPKDFSDPPTRPPPTQKRRAYTPGLEHFRRIEITDFTLFDRLALDLHPPKEQRGQWIVLLGENGRGKSTLLRAIALALTGANVAQAALSQYEAPLIRFGSSTARCEVTSGDDPFSCTITNDGTGEVATCEPANGARPRVFAYGCRRGSGMGSGEAMGLASLFSDVGTLFTESVQLHPVRTWLKELKLRALQDPRHEHVLTIVTKKLCALLPGVDRLDIVDNQVRAVAPRLSRVPVPYESLSDGYRTMLAWTADLCARWLHWAEQAGESTEGDFFARMKGLVLVDEIDLYLHPRWQRIIIRELKEVFPCMSFVVTTHNPLTLLGAEANEIVVLREAADGSGRTEAKQIDLPPGIRADRILTGEWFGLPYTVDDDTIELIEKHQSMLLGGISEDAPERRALEDALAARYGSYADTSIDRMALEVAAELMRERTPKTPEERRALRDKLRARVEQRLAAKERPAGAKG